MDQITLDDYLGVPDELRAVARCQMDAETPAGSFHNEYVWFFKFNDDGTKIVEVQEFLDRKAAEEILRKLTDAGLLESHRV